MPELPEVETVIRTLEGLVKDEKIKDVEIRYTRIIEGNPLKFKEMMCGQHFRNFLRRGKYLLFEMDDFTFVSHLRMEGKYFYENEDMIDGKHSHIIFHFDSGYKLAYNDTRKFGRMEIIPKSESYRIFKDLGPEPFSDDYNLKYCKDYLANEKRSIKAILLDQSFVAGIGNIYADEIIFKTGIHPELQGLYLDEKTINNLITNTREILSQAIEMGGTTIRSYTSSLGVTGRFQMALRVHQKEGQKCPKCNQKIKKIKVAQRGTYICPNCQKLPYRIGITGTIASGKSSVIKYLESLGYKCFSADEAVNELYQKGQKGYEGLKELFPEVFDGETLDKSKLSKLVFEDKKASKQIEEFIHPLVLDKYKAFSINQELVFGEIPLLFEASFDKYFDEILVIYSDENKIIKRLSQKGISKDKALKIIAKQMPTELKIKRADVAIGNNSTIKSLYAKIDMWIKEVYARKR